MTQRWHSAADVCGHLGGRWTGKRGRARCPVAQHSSDKSPLAISQTRDGRVLVFCHAGCDQRAVIAALQLMGLWGEGEPTMDPNYPGYLTTRHDHTDSTDERKARECAQGLWDVARTAKGTLVEQYLQARGIRVPPTAWSELRYLPRLQHGPTRQHFPGMIARISDNRGFCAVQRTFLERDKPRKANIVPSKMTKGPMGKGCVRLRACTTDTLGLAEGIETALSAAQLYSMPVWATLSAQRLSRIELPHTVRFLTVFGDEGEVGRREAFLAADEYERRGIHVEVVFPSAHFKTTEPTDFNSVITDGLARCA